MEKKLLKEITKFIEPKIADFHQSRLKHLLVLKLKNVLKRKNPYLFKAKDISTSQDLVKSILDAHLSSQEEAIFGAVLESLAIFICNKVYRGGKSSSEGIDLEFKKDKKQYIVSIKSGPNWANSGQIKNMLDNFKKAKIIGGAHIVAINGCCYGVDDSPNKGDYMKLCGQRFWEFISGHDDLYIDIIEPLGHKAREKNAAFSEEYAKVINKFTKEFGDDYCDKDGAIRWNELVKFNSKKKN
jgi:hypothetical protein